jgi:hypothetical protein
VDKHLVKWSYWLGLACAAIALVIRALQVVGLYISDYLPIWVKIGYMNFYKAAFLLFAVAIATATTISARQKE